MSRVRLALSLTVIMPLAACVQTVEHDRVGSTNASGDGIRKSLAVKGAALGLSEVQTSDTKDGGLLVNGLLRGRQFAMRIPPRWNHQTVLFAHGYTPLDGKKDTVPTDPVAENTSEGILPHAYAEQFAVAHSAYDKRGMAVTSGIANTVALKHVADAIGSRRAYITGGSMGGSITVLASQRHPDQFVGALAACGVVSDWTYEIDFITQIRVLYNYFTRNTPYALPGSDDVTRTVPGLTMVGVLAPMARLATDANAKPDGDAAKIMRLIASSVPGTMTQPELSTFLFSAGTQALGIDDMRNEFGGLMVGNRSTVYHSGLLNDDENRALNAGVQRFDADPSAVQSGAKAYDATGDQTVKLLTVHNAYDPLVPYEHEERLRQRVEAAGMKRNLAQQTLPTVDSPIPTPDPAMRALGSKAGAIHCGFSDQQMSAAFDALRLWVETGKRPSENARTSLAR